MMPEALARLDAAAPARPDTGWRAYWDRLEERAVFPVEAADYVARVAATVGVPAFARVLDFGCGFGHVAALLAPGVREVAVWDASKPMRRAARRRLARFSNVRVLAGPAPDRRAARFDLVLVNSVVQYMTPDEFNAWLDVAPGWLARDGRIVLSDLLTGEVNPLRELAELLWLCARGGVLLRILREGLLELRHYARVRRARPLSRVDLDELSRRAARLGLSVDVLARNLAYRSARTSVVLSRAAAEHAR
jgi:SAM-dependent methyltransferase